MAPLKFQDVPLDIKKSILSFVRFALSYQELLLAKRIQKNDADVVG